MKLPANPWQNLSPPQKIIFTLASLCVVGLIALAALVLEIRSRQQGALPQADSVPLQDCQPSTLVLGQTTFEIQILPLGSDGLSNLPTETAGIAYWVGGSQMNPVFVLSPTPDNLSVVSTIDLGSEATATWSDCTVLRYPVTAHEPGIFDASDQPDRLQEGITIFFPIDASGAGFVFTARGSADPASVVIPSAAPAENTQPAPVADMVSPAIENTSPPSTVIAPPVESTTPLAMINTATTPSIENALTVAVDTPPAEEYIPPAPDGSEVEANIGLLEVMTAPDGKTIKLDISIYNYGGSAFTLSTSDISLTQPDGTPLVMVSSEPPLTKQIAPAATEMFTLTFPHPSSEIVTLKIFTVEYDVEGY